MSDPRSFNPSDNFAVAASIGLFSNVEVASGYAQEDDLPADTEHIVGLAVDPADLVLPLDTGELIEVFNTDAANAGAVIDILALDVNFEPVAATVTLTAAVPEQIVITDEDDNPLQITRVNLALNRGERGTGEIVTDVDIRTVVGARVVGTIIADAQEMQRAVFTVPAGVKARISSLLVTMEKPTGADTAVDFRLYGGRVGLVFRRQLRLGVSRSGTSAIDLISSTDPSFEGPVDLYLTAVATSACSVGSRLSIIYVR